MYQVIIIGKGPAGISTALYTKRAGLQTLIIGKESVLEKSHKIDNYFGFPAGISGQSTLRSRRIASKNAWNRYYY